jgi:hypothetical protein
MKRPVNAPRALVPGLALALALLGGACGHDIGDSCKTSVDCDPNGTRACDLSQPEGYCTIAGCDETSCPSSSICIRVFPTDLLPTPTPMTMCDTACEDADCPGGHRSNLCAADEICVSSGVSSGTSGVCAKQAYERRYCAHSCSSDSDCRAGYTCRATGENGSMLLHPNPLVSSKFCAPYAPPLDGGVD